MTTARTGHFLDPGRPRPSGSPLMVVGFVLGLLASSPAAVLYYWFFAPVVPLILTVVLRIGATLWSRLYPVAEGALAAALFAVVAVVAFAAGLRIAG